MSEYSKSTRTKIKDCFKFLSQEAREFSLGGAVQSLDAVPSALAFYREFVSPNKPVVLRGLIDHWPALTKWSPTYIREKMGQQTVTVTLTPNGYADAVHCGKFVMPDERRMTMGEFLDALDHNDHVPGVPYIQKQNSNLADEFAPIIDDVESDLSLGSEAFGKAPDAVNFWMGDGRAVTSMHRDPYENLYCVVSGWKTFILIPPTDQPFVPYVLYQAAKYKLKDSGEFEIEDDTDSGQVPWIDIDPLRPDLTKYPDFANAHRYEVTVNAGETLYLPAMWFHHVRQSHGCIAVNYWYDMDYDIKYNYYKFVEKVMDVVK
ncbi:bifunctional peptidase and (3S)-lysyl hydroxylase Jmjd7-like [Gigantopelta aegis]|uniref:bifunctional peptidase and (3S)-lysyl hydroxylase Jmjd7-like n=1 Tax=Gigantopelta aegis TaxID=1735272 RepID=UPI001B88E288|nr:bifunctional peptidase and (3S)-lysyl hydroxylase Jmjd7-like [Gigantopelta aegis]